MSSASDSRKFWQSISQFTSLIGKRRVEPPWPCSSPSIVKSLLKAINKFFVSAVNNIVSFSPLKYNGAEATLQQTGSALAVLPNLFHIRPVSADDVTKAVKAMSSPATSSVDKISLQLLKMSLSAIASPIAQLFNMSIISATFPSSWKIGQVVPVHKKSNRSDYNNYRPITLLQLLSKVLERTIH